MNDYDSELLQIGGGGEKIGLCGVTLAERSVYIYSFWKPAVTKPVYHGTPLGFREDISTIAKNFTARANRQFGNFFTLSSFGTHRCSVLDIERVRSVHAGNGERENALD